MNKKTADLAKCYKDSDRFVGLENTYSLSPHLLPFQLN